jgi:cell division septal protein FtsQ
LARRSKRFNLPRPLRIKNLILVMLLGFLIWGGFDWIRSFISASPYFRVGEVEIVIVGRTPLTKDTIKRLLDVHKNRSIFDIDLKATRDIILSNYPEVKRLIVNRVFPNKLVLIIRPRRPIAQISLPSGFCLIDSESIVLPDIRALASADLPVIAGLDQRSVISRLGKKYDYLGLRKALRLIGVLDQTGFSQGHEIHMVDVSDARNLSLYIEGGIEIKIGGEDFVNRLYALNKTFETARLDKTQIKYIDLRFGNVIIGPK